MSRHGARPWRTRVVIAGPVSDGMPQIGADLDAVRRLVTDPRHGIAYASRTTVLTRPTAPLMLDAVRRRGRLRDDVLVVYFSGHGVLDRTDPHKPFLRLTMADSRCLPGRPETYGMPYRELAQAALATNAGQVVVVLDCCYSGRALADVRDERLCVFASVQDQRRTPQFQGQVYSPYTETLIAALRTPREEGDGSVDAATLGDRLTHAFVDRVLPTREDRLLPPEEERTLTRDQRKARAWHPQYSHTGARTVLHRPGGWQPDPPGKPPETALRRALTQVSRAWARRRVRVVAGVTALAGLVAGVVVALPGQNGPSCPPPIEVRVTTSNEMRPVVAAAAQAYESDPGATSHQPLAGDHAPRGCRRIDITVAAADSRTMLAAFADAQGWQGGGDATQACTASLPPDASSATPACFAPLRDTGLQPDVWIPDTTAEALEAEQAAIGQIGVTVTADGSVASSPLVLGVPAAGVQALSHAGVPAGDPASLDALMAAVAGPAPGPGLKLLRPNPATSGTGLQQTIALYLDAAGRPGTGVLDNDVAAHALENQLSAPGAPNADSELMLCTLAQASAGQSAPSTAQTRPYTIDDSALLVSEKAVRDYDAGAVSEPGCTQDGAVSTQHSLVAYPVAGAPALDYPFVDVDWHGRDETRRQAAVKDFRTWLTGPDGAAVLQGPLGNLRAPLAPGAGAARPNLTTVTQVLSAYRSAQEPGRVLFVLDVSGSMADEGKLTNAVEGVRRAIRELGPKDQYQVWTFTDTVTRLTPDWTSDPAVGDQALASVTAQPKGAYLYETVDQALDVGASASSGQHVVVVVITDGDDRATGDEGQRQASSEVLNRLTTPGASLVPTHIVALPPGGCTVGPLPTPQIMSRLTGADCQEGAPDLSQQIPELIAPVTSGG